MNGKLNKCKETVQAGISSMLHGSLLGPVYRAVGDPAFLLALEEIKILTTVSITI